MRQNYLRNKGSNFGKNERPTRSWNHVQELIDYAQEEKERIEAFKASGGKGTIVKKEDPWREYSVDERLKHALIKGIDKYIDEDTE